MRSLRALGYGFGRKGSHGERAEIDPRGLPAIIPVSSQFLCGIRAAIYILEFNGFPFATQHIINHFQNYRGDKGEMVDPRASKEKIVTSELFKPGASAIRAVMAVLQKTHTVVIPVTWDLEETRRMVENRVPTELKVLAWEQPYLLDSGSGSYKILQLVVDLDAANIVLEDAKRDLDPDIPEPVRLTDLPTVFTNPEGTVLTERLGAHPEGERRVEGLESIFGSRDSFRFRGEAKLVYGDGGHTNVDVLLSTIHNGNVSEWGGTGAAKIGSVNPGEYDIVLSDGREGRVLITDINVASGRKTCDIIMSGTGMPPTLPKTPAMDETIGPWKKESKVVDLSNAVYEIPVAFGGLYPAMVELMKEFGHTSYSTSSRDVRTQPGTGSVSCFVRVSLTGENAKKFYEKHQAAYPKAAVIENDGRSE
jgi:hypothetical protein